jgi:transcriptional regulator with GAF, ATPase, and Fis domain
MNNENVSELIGEAPEFRNVINAARLVAATDVSVLLLGESGTGKELMARNIHDCSRRRNGAFVSVNCAAVPEALMEAELFGYRKGAFTGADQAYDGRVRAAEGGTLFLDEVGELPLAMQAKLLRFLESGECQVLGEPMPRRVDVRVIAATNRDLRDAVRTGRFREDLFYRLHVVPLELPPLRARRSDIPLLIRYYSRVLALRYGTPAPRYTSAALDRLKSYSWPGNVRELRNICERLVVLRSDSMVDVSNLPQEVRREDAPARVPGFTIPDCGLSLDVLERDLIRQALQRTGGNQSHAARLLGLTRDAFIYRMKKYAQAEA